MIHIPEVFAYVELRYSLITKIIDKIKEYHASEIEKFKLRRIKPEIEFDSYIDYLDNLIEESKERFGSNSSYELEFVIELLELEISNPQNKSLYERYSNAFKYAIQFRHNALQNMSYEEYENSGIKYPERNIETTLLNELYTPNSHSNEQLKYSYNISKASYLNYNSSEGNRQWAYQMIRESSPFFSRYVSFEYAKSDFEIYALVMMALYQDCLENKCNLNMNIPNDLRFRLKSLTVDEMAKLHKIELDDESESGGFCEDNIPDKISVIIN